MVFLALEAESRRLGSNKNDCVDFVCLALLSYQNVTGGVRTLFLICTTVTICYNL